VKARVVLGSHGHVRSAADVPTEVTLLDVVFGPAGASFIDRRRERSASST